MSPLDKLRLVIELRKKQGWDAAYVEGEMAAISFLLEVENKTPEDVAKASLQEDWPSFVASFLRR